MHTQRFASAISVLSSVFVIAAALFSCCCLAPSFAVADTAADPLLAEMGAAPFQQYCASCHGTAGKGDGPVAGVLMRPPADLTGIASRRGGEFPSGEIARYIDGRFEVAAHGSREMPIWGTRFAEGIPDFDLGWNVESSISGDLNP